MAKRSTKTKIADCNTMIRQWLKGERKSVGLSQALLAKKIGKPRSFVADYEAGTVGLDIGMYMMITRKMQSDPLTGIELILTKGVLEPCPMPWKPPR